MAGREQRKYQYKRLFQDELHVLDQAKEALDKNRWADESRELYSELINDYEKLLKTAMKISRISDIQGETLKKQEQELHEAHNNLKHQEQIRRQLIADISHELGTPMSTIQGYIKAMLDRVITADDKYLRMIYNKILTVNHLIKDLFLLTSQKAQNMPYYRRPLKANDLLERLSEHHAQLCKAALYPDRVSAIVPIAHAERIMLWLEPTSLTHALVMLFERPMEQVLWGATIQIDINYELHHHDSRIGKLFVRVTWAEGAQIEQLKDKSVESFVGGLTVQLGEKASLLTIPIQLSPENFDNTSWKENLHDQSPF
jgi:signal transduction histidine kinase